MTNEEIIARKAIEEGLFSEDEIIRKIKQDEDIPLHTARGWKDRGYQVKEGERGIVCRLWKQKNPGENEDKQFYQIKSYLYRKDQVKKGRYE